MLAATDSIPSEYRKIGIVLLGDFRGLTLAPYVEVKVSSQMFKQNTRGNAILDLIVTNMAQYFNPQQILPPIVPSDPNLVLWPLKVSSNQLKSFKSQCLLIIYFKLVHLIYLYCLHCKCSFISAFLVKLPC